MESNDQVERRGFAPTQNEGNLYQSSIPSLATEAAARDRSTQLLCGADFDEFALRRRWRDGFARFAQGLDVEFNALANEFQYFSARLANRNAAGKVWNVRTIACLVFFTYH